MNVRIVDATVMLVGSFLIGWHLVTPRAAEPAPVRKSAAEFRSPVQSNAVPDPVAVCEEPPPAPKKAAPRPVAPAPDADRLPDDYLRVLGLPAR